MSKINVAIAGVTGYTGSELLRILLNHPDVKIEALSSETHAGKAVSDVHAFLPDNDMKLVTLKELVKSDPDVIFLGFPHGVSMDFVKKYGNNDFSIIDLSGDFRFSDPEVYREWYDQEHQCPEFLKKAAFGLPELNRTEIKSATLIGNPGCYPTSIILPLYPLIKEGIADPAGIISDSKSGVTGAGIKPSPVTHYPSASENFKAYGLLKHRHTGEIQYILSKYGGTESSLLFTPHLLPVNRGILSTIYVAPMQEKGLNDEKLRSVYEKYYAREPFVRIRKKPPELQGVRGSNYCDIYATYDERTKRILIISCIDNLVKGAAGQAVQNMNLMFDLGEKQGLEAVPVSP